MRSRSDFPSCAFWLSCVLFLTSPTSAGGGEHGGPRYCSRISRLATYACRSSAREEYWLVRARCETIEDAGEREACREEAFGELKEAIAECREILDLRLELCDELGEGNYAPEIDPDNFVEEVDNPYMPLKPGSSRIYEAQTEDGLELTEVSVTFEKKEILGVECTVVRDTVSVEGELVEDTFDWIAQDVEGNVWYFGELSFEHEDGKVVGLEGSWEAGVDGAKPGILMKAAPRVGDIYRQEFLINEAEDVARVVSLSEPVSVPYGDFVTIETEDFTPLEPDGLENKFYAFGIGVVLEENPETGERVELVDAFGLDEPGELDEVEMHLVHDATDDEAAIELGAETDEEGFDRLQLFDEEGELVFQLDCPNAEGPGERELELTTPETSLEEIMEGYPEGEYLFVAWTLEGALLAGEVELSHELPGAPLITAPEDGAEDVDPDGLTASWDPVPGVAGYVLELELDDAESERSFEAELDGETTSFLFPAGWVLPGAAYSLDVAAVGENGNRTVVDIEFATASE